MAEPAEAPAGRVRASGSGLVEALAFVALAAALRSPALLYSVLNFDESVYLLIGKELAAGVLPYTGVCDRKPFGLFALFALFAAQPLLDPIAASRLAASAAVGLTAAMLSRVAGLLFADEGRRIGRSAGLAYVLFSLATGGLTSNAELFHVALAVLGLLLMLLAVEGRERPRAGLLAAAGLALGVGVQVKQTVLFDSAAFLVGFYFLTTPRRADLGRHVRATAPGLAAVGLAAALPTLVVVAIYAGAGEPGAWAAANLGAQQGHLGDRAAGFAFDAAFRALVEQAPLWVGAAVAVLGASRHLRGRAEARALVFLLAWVGAVAACQLVLRIAADHYFLQFLPPLSLLAGLTLGRGVLARAAPGRGAAAVLACLAGLVLFAVAKDPYVNAAYMLRGRLVDGEAYAGDNARRLAADLRPALAPGDAVYVLGFAPVIYHLTGAGIPTRRAFTGLPPPYPGRDGCPWVEPRDELLRVLDGRPRFVVVEMGAYWAELDEGLRRLVKERLRRDYHLYAAYPQHPTHRIHPFERFVMNGAAAFAAYELTGAAGPRYGGPPVPPGAGWPAGLSALPHEEGGGGVVPDDPDGDPGQGG